MSKKWHEVKRWDNEHLTGPLRPVKWVLHALSSITLAVILLSFVACYGALASIPIGLVALMPTWGVIVGSAMVTALAGGIAGALIARALVPRERPGWRFSSSVILFILLASIAAAGWYAGVWPRLRYDPVTGEGLRFFGGFVEQYRSTTLRRLPGFEMSELEFYSWWPLRYVLLLFVINMVVATTRRIEFNFKNLGVLTVHTGIIVIALGSVYYQALKKEGDALLRAGIPDSMGRPAIGPPVRGFYDNTAVALWVYQRTSPVVGPLWDPRPLRGLPRYNDYALDAAPEFAKSARVVGPAAQIWAQPQRRLDLLVPPGMSDSSMGGPRVDPDISFRVVGYAEYAEPEESLLVVDDPTGIPPDRRNPLRVVDLLSRLPESAGGPTDPERPAFSFTLRPLEPAGRLSANDVIAVEYAIGMDPARRRDLLEELPPGTRHALVVEIPADDGRHRVVLPTAEARVHEVSGWRMEVKKLLPLPPFAIVTPGYEGGLSSLAIVQITPPGGAPFERWIYHRYEEITQDLGAMDPSGRASRRMADPSIRVSYLDASKLQLYFDEQEDGLVDLIVREPAGPVRVIGSVPVGQRIMDVVDRIDFRVAEAHAHAEVFEHPVPVPEASRQRQLIGTHGQAMMAVEVECDDPRGGRWSTVVWVPFLQYLGTDPTAERLVTLPDGRSITLQFGRVWHTFPGFAVQLTDFQMIAYDHRGSPRDYQSIVRVVPTDPEPRFEAYEHVVKLNAPLRAPFMWSESRTWSGNMAVRLAHGINPNQFKLAQSGWDRDGWMQTQRQADAGQLPRPFARYTILQVGNNPGIHVIAFGSVLMGVGIPWAFYVKPWLIRREKRRLAESARGAGAPRTKTEGAAKAVRHA